MYAKVRILSEKFIEVIEMITGLTGAAALFLKFAPYIIGIKVCTSTIDVVTAYVKHRVTRS
jgi:hypothetical protein